MAHSVTVAVVGGTEVAVQLGKKGTASDVTLFNNVHDGHTTTLVEPTQFPEKMAPLVNALSMADQCLLVLPELNRVVAETIATVEVSDVPTTIVVGPAVGPAEVARLLKGGRLETAPRCPLDFPLLRAQLEAWTAPEVAGTVRVPLDHASPVKGVGAVALGVVRQGTLHAHERLRLWPSPKVVEVRSIQVHDEDRKDAGCGERVGVALKGIEADELSRGQVLAPEGALLEGIRLRTGPLSKSRYYRGNDSPGAHLHLAIGLQVVPVFVEEQGPEGGVLVPDRPVAFSANDRALLIDLSVPSGPRIVGQQAVLGVG
ncbi:MAG: hypothetical protein L3K10_01050 [Thermoplasmata archaeon]|nr:hypothetical protein [Thermoplasmata archaeon]